MNSFPHGRHPIIATDLSEIVSADLPFDNFEGKTVLVSGANGFIASYLISALLFRNELLGRPATTVVAVARNRSKLESRFGQLVGRPDFQPLIQDVNLPIDYHGQLDYVVHAASQASPKYYGVDPVGTHLTNTLGTYHLLSLCARLGASKFLFVSSGEVYGDTSELLGPIGEHDFGPLDPTNLRSCYAEGKRAGENLCISWSEQYGLATTIARLSHTYGPGMDLKDGRVFADFVANAVAGTDIVMTSDGTAMRPFCYLTDATVGLLTVLLRGKSAEAYNLANADAMVRIRDLAEIVCGLSPTSGVRAVFDSRAKPTNYIASTQKGTAPDTSKIRALGWLPRVTVEEGFRRTIASYLSPN